MITIASIEYHIKWDNNHNIVIIAVIIKLR